MKIVAFAGGVGGAKMVDGLAQCLPSQDLTVIVNTADDFTHLGLHISPDLDTVCYTLAGLANPKTGWGRADETWHTLEELKRIGGPAWFNIGDLDLATHLERTRLLREGNSLSEVTNTLCSKWGIDIAIYPMSDAPVQSLIHTKEQETLSFQEYFVLRRFEPQVTSIEFSGIENANAAPDAVKAINDADWIIFCPSNPFVSIDPILSVSNIANAIRNKKVLAVSPLIGGKALKGPAAKMFQEFGKVPSAVEVAKHYEGKITHFILDKSDVSQIESIEAWGIMSSAFDIYMPNRNERKRLAQQVIHYLEKN